MTTDACPAIADRTGREIGDLDTFGRRHPEYHLLRGRLDDGVTSREIGVLRRRLRGFLGSLPLKGDYVTALVRTEDLTELHCRFADSDDAEIAAAWFNARKAAPQGHGSHRCFVLDQALRQGLSRYGRSDPNPESAS